MVAKFYKLIQTKVENGAIQTIIKLIDLGEEFWFKHEKKMEVFGEISGLEFIKCSYNHPR